MLIAQTGPAGIGTSATNVLWLKADAGTSSSTNNTPLSYWNDASGNNIDVTQTVSAQQPSFATNVLNGFPAILFDDVNTTNQNDKLIGPDSPLLDNTSAYTFFYVTRPVNFGNARVIVSKRTGVAIDQSFMLFYYTSNKLNIDIQTNNDRYASNTTFSSNINYIGCLIYNGTLTTAGLRTTLYDGETFDRNAAETSTIVPNNNSPLCIGTTDATDPRPFGGYIAEILMYRTVLTTAQRIIVNNYLSAKYDIALSANDKYAGDNSANGNYDREVVGIGQESSGSTTSFSASISGGLSMTVNSGLDNGDYILAGHAVATNTTLTSDVGGMTGANNARWQRDWYFDITNTSTNISANLEFDMSDGGMGTFTLGVASNYVLLYRAGQTGNWTEVSSASSITGDRILFNSITLTNDGYYTLGSKNFNTSPLPIELINFSAKVEDNQVELFWSTASERNNYFFEVERSQNGIQFELVQKLAGAGNSNTIKEYQTHDENPYAGISYYRLKQIDLDGKNSYSQLVSIEIKTKANRYKVFPNPANGLVYIQASSNQTESIYVDLLDANGKICLSETLESSTQGTFLLNIEKELPSGIYTLKIFGEEHAETQSLILR